MALSSTVFSYAGYAFPPGSDEAIEEIFTNSYPIHEARTTNVSGSWQQDDIGWWWEYEDGTYAINTWEYINDRWYFFNSDGYMEVGWQLINGEWFYLETVGNSTFPFGVMVTGWYEIEGYWYYFYSTAQYGHSAGAMVRGWLNLNGYSYYFYMEETGENPMGSMATGWLNIGGELFYFDETNGRLSAGEAINIGIDVYTDSTFRSQIASTKKVDDIFELVGIPFEKTWNLLFGINEYESDGLPIDSCSSAPSALCTCVADEFCSNSSSTNYHHKNAQKLLDLLLDDYESDTNLVIGLAGSPTLCWISGNHIAVYGLTYSTLGVAYCGMSKTDIVHGVRVLQHEISHMFGCHDNQCVDPCTMNGGFDNFPLYTENIWCSNCRNGVFVRSSREGL